MFAKSCALDHTFEESVPDCHCEDGCSELTVIKYCLMTVRKATELRDFKATEPFLEAFKKSVQDRDTEITLAPLPLVTIRANCSLKTLSLSPPFTIATVRSFFRSCLSSVRSLPLSPPSTALMLFFLQGLFSYHSPSVSSLLPLSLPPPHLLPFLAGAESKSI